MAGIESFHESAEKISWQTCRIDKDNDLPYGDSWELKTRITATENDMSPFRISFSRTAEAGE